MRISLLLQREPFGKIIEQTLLVFFQKHFEQKISVKWYSKKKYIPSNSGQIWFCNPYTNTIFTAAVKQNALQPALNEFSRSRIWWRRPIQKLYVFLASCRFSSSFLAPYAILVSPPVNESENFVILGGNHHIRLIDSKTNQCFVICKSGFDKDMMALDINIRQQHPYLPAPKIYDYDRDFTWYSESFITGTPINRLEKINRGEIALKQVSMALKKLYEETLEDYSLVHYSESVMDRIEIALEQNSRLSLNEKRLFCSVLKDLKQIVSTSQNNMVPVVQSHGDFQPANILLDEEKSWLIDWEYTRKRQFGYDGLVFFLESRFPGGLAVRVKNALIGKLMVDKSLFGFDWADKEKRRISLALFLLEEIDLHLMENACPMIHTIDKGLFVFIEQAAIATRDLMGD